MQKRWEQGDNGTWSLHTYAELNAANANFLHDTSPEDQISASFERAAGTDSVKVLVRLPVATFAFAAGEYVNVILEGSNDNVQTVTAAARDVNDHWITLSELNLSQWISAAVNTAAGDIVRLFGCDFLLGVTSGDPNVVVSHFKYLRLRFAVEAGAPTVGEMDVTIIGYSRDSDTITQSGLLTYGGLTTVTSSIPRDPNSRYYTVQYVMTAMLRDAAPAVTGFTAFLQGSMDGTNWANVGIGHTFTADVPPGAASTSGFQTLQGRTSIDVDAYRYLRVAVVRTGPGPAGANTNFTMSYYLVHDAYDIAYQQSTVSSFAPELAGIFCRVVFGQYVDAGGHTGSVSGQVLDLNNRPITSTLPVRLILTDAATQRYAGDMAGSLTSTFSAVTTGTLLYPNPVGATNTILLETDENGLFTVTIADPGANNAVISAVPYVPTNQYIDGDFGAFPVSVNHNFAAMGLILASSQQRYCAIL